MGLLELFILAIGLSLDAFAVSVGKGLSQTKVRPKHMLICGAWFGGFQFLMPVIGYFIGSFASGIVEKYDHWIAFILLALIGINMIREALKGGDEETDPSLEFRIMLLMAIATSIDALAVGVSFGFLQVQIVPASLFIGCITFILSMIGVKIGSMFGSKYGSRAEFVGGVILICIGLKILLEHLGIIG